MIWVPIFLGVAAVLQGVLNRQEAAQWGLSTAVLVNSTVFLISSATFFLLVYYQILSVPEWVRPRLGGGFSVWYLVPGILGFLLVLGIPLALNSMGVFKVFVLMIASQLLISLLWDKVYFKLEISLLKALGGVMILLGAILVSFQK